MSKPRVELWTLSFELCLNVEDVQANNQHCSTVDDCSTRSTTFCASSYSRRSILAAEPDLGKVRLASSTHLSFLSRTRANAFLSLSIESILLLVILQNSYFWIDFQKLKSPFQINKDTQQLLESTERLHPSAQTFCLSVLLRMCKTYTHKCHQQLGSCGIPTYYAVVRFVQKLRSLLRWKMRRNYSFHSPSASVV